MLMDKLIANIPRFDTHLVLFRLKSGATKCKVLVPHVASSWGLA